MAKDLSCGTSNGFALLYSIHTPHYENVPFEVPSGWCITDIGELLINRDGERKPVSLAIRSKQKNKVYDYYGAVGVIDKVDNYLFDECLLLIGEDGANLLTRNKNNAFLADGKYWVNNHAHVLDTIDKFILSYVAIVINSMKLDDYITGSAQPKLSQDNLNKIPIFLPPLNEQKRIMTELERWFALIDQIDQGKVDLQETIKRAKSKVLDLAIHGKLVPQDPNDEPAIELLKRINPNFTPCDNGHYLQLPDSWSTTTLKDLCESINGLWKGKKEPFIHVGVIRNANFTKDFKLDYSNIEYIDVEQRTFAKRHLMSGDLIVEKSGGSDNNPVGRTILYEGESGVFSFSNFTMVLRIKHSNIISSKFLYYYILAIYQKGAMRLMQTQTTGLHNLILDKFLSMPIHIPSYSEQERIVDRIETIFISFDMIMESS